MYPSGVLISSIPLPKPANSTRGANSQRVKAADRDYGFGTRNLIVSGTGYQYFVPDFKTPLSIKTVISGSVMWETPGRRYVVHENTYLVLNDGQHYQMTIDSNPPSTTFCLFFKRGFAEEVHRTLNSSVDALLEVPSVASPPSLEFRERLEPSPGGLLAHTRKFHAAMKRGRISESAREEAYLNVASVLIREQFSRREENMNFSAVRTTTREELYRRLLRGRDYLLSSLAERPTIAEAARAACLSPYHFLRTFREAFGKTPHQYLTLHRLERARLLLESGNNNVTEVCLESGFQSLGSFSSLFRRHFGFSPQQARLAASR